MVLTLESLGWDSFFELSHSALQKPGFEVGRVAIESSIGYVVYSTHGELAAEVSGKLRYRTESPSELPKVGDWVVITVVEAEDKAIIHDILPRKSKFSRKAAGQKAEEQIVAANIDTVFIVQSLDKTFNVRRIERYLATAREGGAEPVVILNKADLCDKPGELADQVRAAAPGVTVFAVSARTGYGVEHLKAFVQRGITLAFVGPSGAGKSTLINILIGKDVQKTGSVRESDSKGRHTTTRRELLILPAGGLLIDTPGMREIQLWDNDRGLAETFSEIDEAATGCRFSDCSHTTEPGCAVLEAVCAGGIAEERYAGFMKLQQERQQLETKYSVKTKKRPRP